MDHLWSPWRYNYVSSTPASPSVSPTEPAQCIFCRAANSSEDFENLIVFRGERNLIMLNRYPYSSGHVMIAPYSHVASLEEADTATLEEVIRLAQKAEKALRRVYSPGGFNFGFNIGQCAGAGIAGHIHMHGLPRWPADSSFMTTIAETRVLPEDLETTFRRVSEALRR